MEHGWYDDRVQDAYRQGYKDGKAAGLSAAAAAPLQFRAPEFDYAERVPWTDWLIFGGVLVLAGTCAALLALLVVVLWP